MVGAGAAGTAASLQLSRWGYKVTLIEARDRLGGRVFGKEFASNLNPVDLGAMVITGEYGNPIKTICRQQQTPLHVLGDQCPIFSPSGNQLDPLIDSRAEKFFNSILERSNGFRKIRKVSNAHDPEPLTADELSHIRYHENGDLSLGDLLDTLAKREIGSPNYQDVLPADLLNVVGWYFANLEYGCASELHRVSLEHWDQDDQFEFEGRHFLVPSSFQSIFKPLWKELSSSSVDLITEKPVSKITLKEPMLQNQLLQQNDRLSDVTVECQDGSLFFADAVLVTVPLAILQQKTIEFDPELPSWKTDSINRLGSGVINKMALVFDHCFWDINTDYFGRVVPAASPRGRSYMFWNLFRSSHQPILLSILSGKAALDAEKMPKEELIADALDFLREIFGSEKVPNPIYSDVSRWSSDPYAGMSYSFVAVGGSGNDYDLLAKPVTLNPISSPLLFFAGEATNRYNPASVGGNCFLVSSFPFSTSHMELNKGLSSLV